VLQVRGPVVVDLAGFRLPDLASAPIRAGEFAALFKDVLEGIPELPAEPEQEHEHVAAQDRQLEFPQQVPQPAGRQTETFPEEGGGLRGGSAEPIVKQSRGFGPAACIRLETDRDPTHFGTCYHIRVEQQCGRTLVSGSAFSLVEERKEETKKRERERDENTKMQRRERERERDMYEMKDRERRDAECTSPRLQEWKIGVAG